MASEIDICNRALGLLGQSSITSFADDNRVAQICAQLYPAARDKCLEDRKWSFALTRVIIAPLTVPPAFEYANQFQIPSDCLILRSVTSSDTRDRTKWVREGDRILTDIGEIYVTYSRTVTNPDLYTNGFIEALVFKLAADMAIPISANKTLRQTYEQDYFRKIAEAAATDGGQGKQERIRSDILTRSRYSGIGVQIDD